MQNDGAGSITNHYDCQSSYYHLLFEDYDEEIDMHVRFFSGWKPISQVMGKKSRILDCTCGIGTQAFALSRLGHNVVGTDISSKSIEAAQRRANAEKLQPHFETLDARNLGSLGQQFDGVISMDNALTHILEASDLEKVFCAIRSRMTKTGLFLASFRDYDAFRESRPTGTQINFWKSAGPERINFQIWNWLDDNIYEVHEHLSLKSEDEWEHFHTFSRYRAYTRQELSALLSKAGFSQISWFMPEESGYRQPIVVAHFDLMD